MGLSVALALVLNKNELLWTHFVHCFIDSFELVTFSPGLLLDLPLLCGGLG